MKFLTVSLLEIVYSFHRYSLVTYLPRLSSLLLMIRPENVLQFFLCFTEEAEVLRLILFELYPSFHSLFK